jgi:hypothetical protein
MSILLIRSNVRKYSSRSNLWWRQYPRPEASLAIRKTIYYPRSLFWRSTIWCAHPSAPLPGARAGSCIWRFEMGTDARNSKRDRVSRLRQRSRRSLGLRPEIATAPTRFCPGCDGASAACLRDWPASSTRTRSPALFCMRGRFNAPWARVRQPGRRCRRQCQCHRYPKLQPATIG